MGRLALLVLLASCTGSSPMLDAAPDDAGTDAPIERDAGTCARPTHVAYAQAFLAGPTSERPLAIAVDPIEATFVIGGTIGDETAPDRAGFRSNWRDDPAGLRLTRTYGPAGASSVHDLAVDTHGNLTIGGTYVGPTEIERTTASESGGFVARVIAGGGVTVTSLGASVDVTAVSRRGDGYYAAGDFTSTLQIGDAHCDVPGGFVAAFARDGAPEWLRCIEGRVHVHDLAVHDAGEAYVVGVYEGVLAIESASVTSRGGSDGFVARVSGAGRLSWLRSIGTSATLETLAGLVVTGSHVIAVGAMGADDAGVSPSDPPLGGTDGVVVSLDMLAGDDEGLVRLGGPDTDGALAIAADGCGGVWVTGLENSRGTVRWMNAATRALEPDLLGVVGALPSAVAVTQDGAHVVVTGFYSGSPTIAGTTLPPPMTSPSDPFVLGIR